MDSDSPFRSWERLRQLLPSTGPPFSVVGYKVTHYPFFVPLEFSILDYETLGLP